MGVPPLIGTLFFPKIASYFHNQYPQVTLELYELGAKRLSQLVEDGEIDLGIIVLPANETKFNVYPFFCDEFVLYLHVDHKLADREEVSLSELKEEKFVLFSEDFTLHDYIKQSCQEAGFTPEISYLSSQWDLLIELVSSNLGITLMPKSIFYKQSNSNVKIVPIKNPALFWRLGIITKKEAYHSFALKELLKMLEKNEIKRIT
jgi:DNA-binding transcriptional LysR family regulator